MKRVATRSRDQAEQLKAALAALRERKLEPALLALLAAWRDGRQPELASLVERVSEALTETLPPVAPTSSKQSLVEAFRARAADDRAADIGPLLSFLRDHTRTLPHLFGCAAELAAARDPDPRIASGLLHFFESPPFRTAKGSNAYGALFEQLVRHGDPRTVEPVVSTSAFYRGQRTVLPQLGRRGMPALHACADALAALPEPTPLSTGAATLLAAIGEALHAAIQHGAAAAHSVDELFAAVYADPRDDEARLVLADALQDQSDPRGELITLQCAREQSDARPSKRERELLEQYQRVWLGSLDAVVLRQEVVYERGFFAAGRYKNGRRDVNVVGANEWATVRELDIGPNVFDDAPEVAAMLTHPVMRSLRRVRGLNERVLRAITKTLRDAEKTERGAGTLPWTLIALDQIYAAARHLPPFASRLPALKALEISDAEPPRLADENRQWLLATKLAQRLEAVRFFAPPDAIGPIWQQADALPLLKRLALGPHSNWELGFGRGADGRLGELVATGRKAKTARAFHALIGGLDSLPADVLTTLRVTLLGAGAKRVSTSDLLRRACERFTHLETLELP